MKITSFKINLFEALSVLLIVSISISNAVTNILFGLLAIVYFYYLRKKKLVFALNNKTFYLALLLLIVCSITTNLIVSHHVVDHKIISRFLYILIIPIILSNLSKQKIAVGFILATTICILLALFNIIKYYIEFNNIPLANDAEVSELLRIERPYLGFICVLGVLFSLYLIDKNRLSKLCYLFPFFTFLFVGFIAARLSMLSLIISICFLFLKYKKISVLIKSVTTLVTAGLLILFVFNNKNLYNRFFVNSDFETIKAYEPRIEIWNCINKISQSPEFSSIIGLGSNEVAEKKLLSCYEVNIENISKKEYFLNTKFNTHNQFLYFYITSGLVGLFLFLFFIFEVFNLTKTTISKTLFFVFLSFLIIENVFQRQLGCVITAILIAFLVNNQKHKTLNYL